MPSPLIDFEAAVLNNAQYADMVEVVTVEIGQSQVWDDDIDEWIEPESPPDIYTTKAIVLPWTAGGSMFGVQFEDYGANENDPRAYIISGNPLDIGTDTPIEIRTTEGAKLATTFVDNGQRYAVTRIWDYTTHGNYQLLFCVRSRLDAQEGS